MIRPAFLVSLLLLLPWAALGQTTSPVTSAEPSVLFPLTSPFLFAYGTWDKRATIQDGVVVLGGDGITPKGGAGVNVNPPLDLRTRADESPALHVQVGAGNTLKTLKLLLADTGGHTGTFRFALPPAVTGNGFAVLLPEDGASLAHPNEVGDKGPLDLAHVMQWQMMGDWGGDGLVAVRVKGIVDVAPATNPTLAGMRQARVAKDAAAKAQAVADRAAARAKYGVPTAQSPVVQSIYAAAPDVLALEIHSGTITPSRQTPYTSQPGDTMKSDNGATILVRGGQTLGYLIGTKHDSLVTGEGFTGDPLLTAEADDKANYTVLSPDDPAYATGVTPTAIARKSKPEDWQQPKRPGLVMLHRVYLRLPRPLTTGKTYTVALTHLNVQKPTITLLFDPVRVRSESVHVSQVGFRPDDPVKQASVSLWMGDGGGYAAFPGRFPFRLVDAASNRTVFSGHAGDAWTADKPEAMQTTRNFNGTAVYPLDFSGFHTPGNYRVVVDGVGCSYPFEIGRAVWEQAFRVQMKGFYNQRSGVDLGPPYTPFVKPADFRLPSSSAPITQSTYSILDGGDAQKDLAKGDTGRPVPGAWGGYHDAGDWNPRRITHMRTTTFWQLELLDLFPAYFQPLRLNIPHEPASRAPDLLNECLFELSLFRRLQTPEGGVGFGIETNGDPIDGEVSWKQSMPAYVYAPDVQSSYIYAAVEARAAGVLAAYAPAEAQTYRESALRAMAWAESDCRKRQAAGTWAKLPGDVTEDRTLAAACLLALTHDARWNAIYAENPPATADGKSLPFRGSLMRRDAAFTYARLPTGVGDEGLKTAARAALLADADGALVYQTGNAWGIASDDPGKPQFLGFYSTPHGAVSLLRAYWLTHTANYLTGAVTACQFPAGDNPGNLVYTSGVGENPVRHPLNLDSRLTGQPAPDGITVYGNIDFARWGDQAWITWPITYFFGSASKPAPQDWPTTEAYFDVFFMTAQNELTMDQTMGPNAYVWGFLAARP